MSKVKLGLVLIISVFLFACGQKEEVVSLKEVPEVITMMTESAENAILVKELHLKNDNLSSENDKLSLELSLKSSENKGLTKVVNELTATKSNETFWKKINKNILSQGLIDFMLTQENINDSFKYMQSHVQRFQSKIHVENVNQESIMFSWEPSNNKYSTAENEVKTTIGKTFRNMGKNPRILSELCNLACIQLNELPIDVVVFIKSNIYHYEKLLDLSQDAEFQNKAKNVLDVEIKYSSDSVERANAQLELMYAYPDFSLFELQYAYRNLTYQYNDWVEFIALVKNELDW